MDTVFGYVEMLKPHLEGSKLLDMAPPDWENYNPSKYPHFHVFVAVSVGVPIRTSDLKHNADIIAAIPNDKIKTITYNDLLERGYRPNPSGSYLV